MRIYVNIKRSMNSTTTRLGPVELWSDPNSNIELLWDPNWVVWTTQATASAAVSLSPKTPIRHGLRHRAPPPSPPRYLPSSSLPSQPVRIRHRRFSIGFKPQFLFLLCARPQHGELQWRWCDLCEDQGQDIRHHAYLLHDRLYCWEAVLWAGNCVLNEGVVICWQMRSILLLSSVGLWFTALVSAIGRKIPLFRFWVWLHCHFPFC